MTTTANEIRTDTIIRAILKDATDYMATIGPEDLPCNTQHERCLDIIGRAFGAQSECDEARELLRRWEDAVRNGAQPDLDGVTLSLDEPASPNAVTLDFFKAALRLEDAAERQELYNMADYIGEAVELCYQAQTGR
ncbi:MAG: hypothetical protein PHE09_01080 [Oscillospiraceae bacterium]|nr:hypothetical protein [Oscillospiraceae bacterium]